MKKLLCAFFCAVFAASAMAADSRYALEPITDTIAGTVGAAINLPVLLTDGSVGVQQPVDSINFIDRGLISSYRAGLDDISTAAAYIALVMPGISAAGQWQSPKALITHLIMYTEAFLLTAGTKNTLKTAISRHRPYTYTGPAPQGEDDDEVNSFPSGHTSYAFLGATYLTSTFFTENPDSAWKLPIALGSYSLASAIAVLRVASGNHFVTDVVAGALIGSFYGWLIPMIHRRQSPIGLSVRPVPNGFAVLYRLNPYPGSTAQNREQRE